jgi:DNA-binding transcriptional LysR family regulator
MKLELLGRFALVARAGGYQSAQRKEGVPAATLKLAVSALEEDLGIRLFERVGRGIRITPAGRRVLAIHDRIREVIEGLRRDLGAVSDPFREPIRLAAQESYVLGFLPSRLRGFLRRHPHARLDIRHDRAAGVIRRVAEGEVEFGLANDPGRSVPAVRARPIVTLQPVLIAPHGRPVRPTLEGIASLPLILPDRGSPGRRMLEKALRKRGLRPRIVMETGGYSVICQYVEMGLGASVVADLALDARKRFQRFDLSSVLGTRRGYLLLRRRRELSRGAEILLRELLPSAVESRP